MNQSIVKDLDLFWVVIHMGVMYAVPPFKLLFCMPLVLRIHMNLHPRMHPATAAMTVMMAHVAMTAMFLVDTNALGRLVYAVLLVPLSTLCMWAPVSSYSALGLIVAEVTCVWSLGVGVAMCYSIWGFANEQPDQGHMYLACFALFLNNDNSYRLFRAIPHTF